MTPDDNKALKRKNARLGLILATVAAAFFLGVIVKHLLQH